MMTVLMRQCPWRKNVRLYAVAGVATLQICGIAAALAMRVPDAQDIPSHARLFPPLRGGASGHFYTGPALYNGTREMAYVVCEEGHWCIVTKRILSNEWVYINGPDNEYPGNDISPSYSREEDRLYYISTRPAAGQYDAAPPRIWYVSRDSTGDWKSQPEELNIRGGYQEVKSLSISGDGSLYFECSGASLAQTGSIMRLPQQDMDSRVPEEVRILDRPDSTISSPCMAPDESYVIFAAERADSFGEKDLYVAFQAAAGVWTSPVHLGKAVNGPESEYLPRISSDGKILFFSRDTVDPRDQCEFPETMWVSTQVVDDRK